MQWTRNINEYGYLAIISNTKFAIYNVSNEEEEIEHVKHKYKVNVYYLLLVIEWERPR